MRPCLPLLLGIIALWVVSPRTAIAQGVESSGDDSLESAQPDFHLLRQEENWSALAGEEGRRPSLKYVPLTKARSFFLTVGGEARAYGRWYRNEQWGRGPERDAYLLQRFMLHGSVQTRIEPGNARARIFTQLKSGLVANRDGPIYPPDKDLLGLNQAFLELTAPLGSDGELALRMGRQELHYGAGRMIAVREGPNVRLGFDAALGRYRNGPWRGDLFAAKPNVTSPGVFDNGWMPGRTLWGLHVSRRRTLSLYYFGTKRNPSPTDRHLQTVRHTIGGRRHGTLRAIGYDLEGAVQLGHYRRRSSSPREELTSGSVRAWMLAGRLSYRLPDRLGRPTVGLQADVSSGDVEDTRATETFAAPYPSGRFTGAGSRLGPGNLLNVRPFLDLLPTDGFHVQVRGHLFWRTTSSDGIYAIWGAPLRPASYTDTRFIGAMPEGILTWNLDRHVDLAAEASYFRTGSVLRGGDASRDMIHVGLRVNYVF